MDEYRLFTALYIEPCLGSFAVAKLRPGHVSEWIATLLKEGGLIVKGTPQGRALSPKTVRHAFALLSAALTWGMRVQLVARNVCALVSAPSVRQSEARALTSDEIRAPNLSRFRDDKAGCARKGLALKFPPSGLVEPFAGLLLTVCLPFACDYKELA